MRIYFATWMQEANQGVSLTYLKVERRLLSFFFIKKEDDLKYYWEKGVNKSEDLFC